MSRTADPTKKDSSGRYKSQVKWWASTTSTGESKITKTTLYMTPEDRRLLVKLGKRENITNVSAVVRWALKKAVDAA